MKKGVTLVELLMVIALSTLLVVAGIPVYSQFQTRAQLDESGAQLISVLRQARQEAVAGVNDASHGIFIDRDPAGDDVYIFYQGDSYALRDPAYDRTYIFEPVLEVTTAGFALTGGDVDIVFTKGLGDAQNTGTVIITHAIQGTFSVSVNAFGAIESL
ncbi:prepilin-type N-terminal cleavage/methylation domain-containing protein [Patescibacteria group bacterium]|nr:prepilin-type N-terminal cleavage/methylation domain-containing protein [Patescibacteria group bacterium]MBU1721176.1 prepilin-type N-terminal cleavage/methylation domain-containing protein [Patescibacteria group bacterium]MBU1900894.1 prepilin-type N-terminal cleavage/methylation domain-containing protein [Patescibacteria group bacterium]